MAKPFTLNDLFKQLGLDHSDEAIAFFIDTHGPIDEDMAMADWPCWSPSQAEFLRQAILDDADWSVVVDDLNERMRP